VRVDRDTGQATVERLMIAYDVGRAVNPMMLEGQLVGGSIQGVGGALFEEFTYDQEGQLLTGSLMDYALPRASDSPSMELFHHESRSPLNPLGVKGVGEGGAVAPPAAIANAICDALAPFGVEFNATPVKPEHVVRAVARQP